MIHPHTELRFVSTAIGYGIFATKLIPKGTITWVKDQLDRTFSQSDVSQISEANLENLMKYSYRDRKGNYFFCWDLTRYVNHSFRPNSMLTSMGFEVAIRDIAPGEEMTNDYGTLNIIEPFKCASGAFEGREYVEPDDLKKFHQKWDAEIQSSLVHVHELDQPLSALLTVEQKSLLESIRKKERPIPSILENFYDLGN